MGIDRSNYEVYFLDYLDGSLAEELRPEFDAFLAANPDLADELTQVKYAMEELDLPVTSAPEEVFEFKSELKKVQGVSPEIENLLLKELEGDLSTSDKSILDNALNSDPEVRREKQRLALTKLSVPSVSFEQKDDVRIPDSVDYSVVQNLLIAKAEGDLDAEGERALTAILQQKPELKADLAVYQKLKLQVPAIAFAAKDTLRKREAVVISMRTRFLQFSAAAAVIAFIVWMNFGTAVVPGEIARNDFRDPQIGTGSQHKSVDSGKQNNAPVTSPDEYIVRPGNTAPRSVEEIQQVAEQKESPSMDVRQNQPADTAAVEPVSPESIRNMIIQQNNEIAMQEPTPEMLPVHGENKSVDPSNLSKPRTILSLIGERVEQRLENSYAFGLVERKTEKLNASGKSAASRMIYERKAVDDRFERVRFKYGNIGFEREVSKKKDKPGEDSRLTRLSKKCRNLILN